MRDIESTIRRWHNAGTGFALARVVTTWGSSPRRPGAALVITADLQVAGSLSGGCIEAAVISEAERLLSGKRGPGRLDYGIENESAWSAGLSCGGKMSVYLDEPNPDLWDAIINVLELQRPAMLVTRLRNDSASHILVDLEKRQPLAHSIENRSDLDALVEKSCNLAGGIQESTLFKIGNDEIFVHLLPRPDELLIIGAAHIAVHLVSMARELGFHTVVIDPRRVFATGERFVVAPDELLLDWPASALLGRRIDQTTYAIILTHDPKIDDQALHHLLTTDVSYIGALGSLKTHSRRSERLRKAGFTQAAIDRIRGPVGLSIGAVTPSEIALAILAQVVESKRQEPKTSAITLVP